MKKNLYLWGALAFLGSCQEMDSRLGLDSLPTKNKPAVHAMINLAQQSMFGAFPFISASEEIGYGKEIIQDKPHYILIEVVPNLMKYDTDSFTVIAGEKIILELDNKDVMQHNLLIAKPGTFEKVGAAADAMLRDPKAAEKHYVPEIPEVLMATELVDPGEMFTLEFTAPKEPGYYPFVCTFPGHWRMMNGIMKVEIKK